jgi:hypothetical protein
MMVAKISSVTRSRKLSKPMSVNIWMVEHQNIRKNRTPQNFVRSSVWILICHRQTCQIFVDTKVLLEPVDGRPICRLLPRLVK